jgi:histidine triad (HIT) family protein
MSAACVFCAIVSGDEPASRVYEDGDVLAFMDLHPVNPGHLLVIPKRHAVGLPDLDVDLGAQLWRAGHRLSLALRRTGLRCEGVNLFLADGEAAFQEVFHVHLHVVPRYAGDGFRIHADVRQAARAELDEVAALVTRHAGQDARS